MGIILYSPLVEGPVPTRAKYNAVSVINHDHVKLCKDRNLPKWLSKARRSLEEGETLCICRGPDTGRAMLQCNQCLVWFHCDCIGLSKSEVERMPSYDYDECRHA